MANDGVRIQGEGVLLREWTEADLGQMTSLFDDPEVAYRTPVVTPFDRQAAEAYLRRAFQAKTDGTRLHLAITVDEGLAQGEVIPGHGLPPRLDHTRRPGGVRNSSRSRQTTMTDSTSSRAVWITLVSGCVRKISLPKLAARWKTIATRTLRPAR